MAVESRISQVATGTGALPPGPKGLPVLGPLLELKKDLLGTSYRAMLEFGDVVRFAGAPGKYHREATFLYHPDMVQYVLATGADNFYKGDEAYTELREVLGNGLLTAEGDVWKRQKRQVQPLFTHKTVGDYVPMIVQEGAEAVDRWRPFADGGTVDLGTDMTRVTLRVVGKAVFGADVEHMLPVFKDRVPYLSERAFKRSVNPFRPPQNWPTLGNRRAHAMQADINKVVDDLIADHRRDPDGGTDLVRLLIGASDPETGERLSDDEIRDQALVFLLAGHETTATSLTFTLHLLGHHPDVQRRVHEEVDAVLAGRTPGLEDVRALEYTTMVVKEAMRLYPAAHGMPRQSKTAFDVDGYTIPGESAVVVSSYATHRHPKFWDDPFSFNPERFTPEREKARHRYAYFPFGGGPRACIGQYFSMLESVIVTAMLMQAYEVKTTERKVKLFVGITLRPAEEMPALLFPR
ncbi:MAG TPA: cytochrome P450 [Actinomycetota bacterium]|nr:cytochrome P450 [Actinomycetota bacterium]